MVILSGWRWVGHYFGLVEVGGVVWGIILGGLGVSRGGWGIVSEDWG